jgi:hypothetical protein
MARRKKKFDRFAERYKSAESHDFLPVPIPVPPMIERAFKYRGESRYARLGVGAEGGVMDDIFCDGLRPKPHDLYRQFLLHPAIKPCTDAFQIETDPPAWLVEMEIGELESNRSQFESWCATSRCLLLDRKQRQFFVSTVGNVSNWLLLRGALCETDTTSSRRHRALPAASAVKELFAWLDRQPALAMSDEFVRAWKRRFDEKITIEACVGAGLRLGFKDEQIKKLMFEAIFDPGGDR